MNKQEWKESQAVRKAELKALAKEIRQLKVDVKKAQQDTSYTLTDYNVCASASKNDIEYRAMSIVRDAYNESLYKLWPIQSRLLSLRQKYRHNHIVYCLYNGTRMEHIEPTHDETSDNWIVIKRSNDFKAAKNAQIDWEIEKIRRENEKLKDPDYEDGLFFEQEAV
jgi:hypothetical protein